MNNAEKIKALRKELKLSQQELADLINVSQASVYYWEKNKRKPKVEQLIQLATVFGVPLSYFDCYTITTRDESGEHTDTILIESSNAQNDSSEEIDLLQEPLQPGQKSIIGLDIEEHNILSNFKKLNSIGKEEARKRVEELTEIPR